MKIKRVETFLRLRKETVSHLNVSELKCLRGGADKTLPRFCTWTVVVGCTNYTECCMNTDGC
jgi:hypothetical protein